VYTELGDQGERQVCRFEEGLYLNAGPWRIPRGHSGVLGYCREFGVSLELFIDANDACFSYDGRPDAGPLAGKRVRLRETRTNTWAYASELLAKAADQGTLDIPLTAEDQDRLFEFLVTGGYLASPDRLYRPQPASPVERYDLGSLLRSGFTGWVHSLAEHVGGQEPMFQPVGGMMQIALAFERLLGEKITLGAEVLSVHQTADRVRVTYRDARTGMHHATLADLVVCCLPLSILKTLDINLSPEMLQAVRATDNLAVAKVGLQMKRRFWEEDDGIYGGRSYYTASDGSSPLQDFSYPSNGYGMRKGVLLGFYGLSRTTTSGGTAFVDLPVARRVEHVLTHASAIHPQMRLEFEAAFSVCWDRVKFSNGGYGASNSDRLPQLSKADGRVYLGCAGASSRPGWQEGAVDAAWRTVKAIHERVMAG
jgi:monoamine oxidase